MVREVDPDGDLCIDFCHVPVLQWVRRDAFACLEAVAPCSPWQPEVDQAGLPPGMCRGGADNDQQKDVGAQLDCQSECTSVLKIFNYAFR